MNVAKFQVQEETLTIYIIHARRFFAWIAEMQKRRNIPNPLTPEIDAFIRNDFIDYWATMLQNWEGMSKEQGGA